MDNVIFSKETVWSTHTHDYHYFGDKKGKVVINDAVNITNITNESYDFLFSSHSLDQLVLITNGLIQHFQPCYRNTKETRERMIYLHFPKFCSITI